MRGRRQMKTDMETYTGNEHLINVITPVSSICTSLWSVGIRYYRHRASFWLDEWNLHNYDQAWNIDLQHNWFGR